MDDSPRELVAKARRRDEAAFAELLRRHERAALAIAYAVVGDASAAGDVVQEAFIRVWRRLGELDDPDRFGAWLARIVRNLATDQTRRTRRHESAALDETLPGAETISPLDHVETRRGIDAALAQLDELTRAAVVLRYYEEMSSKQIGELLELTPAAVDMRLSRARSELRDKLAWMNEGSPCRT